MLSPLLLSIPVFLQATPPPTPAAATSELPSPTATGTKSLGPVSHAPSGRVLHLDDAIQVALKAQPLIHESRAQTVAGQGLVEQQRSGFLPQLSGTALLEETTSGASPTGSATTGSTALPSSTPAHGVALLSASGTQLIYDFDQTRDRYRSAQRNVDSLQATEHTTELQVLLTTRTAFFTARADKALVYVAEQTLRNEEKHVAQIRGFVAAGTQPEIALATELTNLGNDRVALITAQNNYAIAKAQLNQSMGVVGDTNYDVAEEGLTVISGEDGPDERLVDTALKARPEIVSYEKAREANELTVTSLKGGYGPTLSALGQVGALDTSLGFAGNSFNSYWTVGAQLVWPFFQGGLTRGQVRTAQANVDYVNAELETEKLQIRLQVEQAVLTVRAAKASIDAANEALVNAREQLRLAEGQYEAGVGNIILLSDAQVAATAAAAQVVQTDFNLSTARAQLLAALGKP
jgi:outer membrane protein